MQLDWTLNTIFQPSVITDSYTPFDWNPFWNQLKSEQLENDNYDCRSNISFFAVSMLTNSGPGNAGNRILESLVFS